MLLAWACPQVRKGVAQPESIADHMYRMGMMALISGDAGVDTNRCVRMALVHDVAEALVSVKVYH